MAAGGVGYFATGYWDINYWHDNYWAGADAEGEIVAAVAIAAINTGRHRRRNPAWLVPVLDPSWWM